MQDRNIKYYIDKQLVDTDYFESYNDEIPGN